MNAKYTVLSTCSLKNTFYLWALLVKSYHSPMGDCDATLHPSVMCLQSSDHTNLLVIGCWGEEQDEQTL